MHWLGAAFFSVCGALALWHSGGAVDGFVALSGFLTAWTLVSAIRERRRAAAEFPRWFSRMDWAGAVRQGPEATGRGTLGLVLGLVLWGIALVWLIMGVRAARDLAATSSASHWSTWLAGGLAVGIPLVLVAALSIVTLLLRTRKPWTGIVLDTQPAWPGQELIGGFPLSGKMKDTGVRLALVCIERRDLHRPNERANERTLWRAELKVDPSELRFISERWEAPFSFELPDDARETSAVEPGSTGIVWRVELVSPTEGREPSPSFEVPVFRRPPARHLVTNPPVGRRRVPIALLSLAAAAVLLVWWCASPSPSTEPRSCDEVFTGSALRACEIAIADAGFDPGVELAECAYAFAGYWDYDLRCIEAVAAAPVDVAGVVVACNGVMRMKNYALRCVHTASASGGGAPAVHRCSDQYGWDADIVRCLRDDTASAERLRGIAEQGDARAQYNLGYLYDNGQGVPQDDAKATNWYRKAAEQGHSGAKKALERRGEPIPSAAK
jgi:hypothetical protein